MISRYGALCRMDGFFTPMTCEPVTTPVTILGGYLGSGKTTLVNQLLRQAAGVKLAILVNDFGDLAIDADLVEAEEGDVISLSGGCVCCSYGNDLTSALVNLQQQGSQADHIVIEASGVALPGSIGGIVSLLRGLMLEGIVVMVDASSIMSMANDKYLSDTIDRQLNASDVIILNKLDLVSQAELSTVKHWLVDSFAAARLIEARQAIVPIELVLGSHDRTGSGGMKSSLPNHDASIFASIEISLDDVYQVSNVAQRLSDPECSLLRAKGFARDIDGEIKTIQVVGKRWAVTSAPEHVSTGLVCIGKRGEFSESSVRRHLGLGEC